MAVRQSSQRSLEQLAEAMARADMVYQAGGVVGAGNVDAASALTVTLPIEPISTAIFNDLKLPDGVDYDDPAATLWVSADGGESYGAIFAGESIPFECSQQSFEIYGASIPYRIKASYDSAAQEA